MADLDALARSLQAAAEAADHRRLIVLHGPREATASALAEVHAALDAPPDASVLLGDAEIDGWPGRRVPRDQVATLLGTTQQLLVLDAHDAFDPNAFGRTVGAVDAGGLYVLLAPPLDAWPERRDAFDAHLAVPPFTSEDVTGRFRQRFVELLRRHEGVAIVDAADGTVEDEGATGSTAPGEVGGEIRAPPEARFPRAVYEACRTRDQARAVAALEPLGQDAHVVVLEADRGRGKSSAAGLAAGALAMQGGEILVTAPRRANTDALFARARELAIRLGNAPEAEGSDLRIPDAGAIRYCAPVEAIEAAGSADAVIVDEAAGLPVHVLVDLLEAGVPIAFATTVHGYEGAGRGFSVRFKDHLAASQRPVTEIQLSSPIRYAPGDPVEAFAFHALLLDARPAVAPLVTDATPETVTHRRLDPDALLADERLLSEAFGLLVLAHYRTSPSDLARLLDAPNLSLHALLHGDHVVSVALLAGEGGLDAGTRAELYEGGRIPGHLIPDLLTTQLRDEEAGASTGARVMRIATHPAVRSRGLGSLLLSRCRADIDADWIGTSYGATPELVRFWRDNGYRNVHLATSRNAASGEHSIAMLDPITPEGAALADRSSDWFLERIPSVLADALSELDPDVARQALAAVDASVELALSDRAIRHVAYAAYGSGAYDANPAPVRRLALKHLVERPGELAARTERLLVAKVLQARPWDAVAGQLGYVSRRMCQRALGDAAGKLLDAYGGEVAKREADRLR